MFTKSSKHKADLWSQKAKNSMKVQVVSGRGLFLETTLIGKVQVHI